MATTTTVDDPLAASLKALAMAGQAPAGVNAPSIPMGGPDPSASRPDLGTRRPPTYSQALAALQRAIY